MSTVNVKQSAREAAWVVYKKNVLDNGDIELDNNAIHTAELAFQAAFHMGKDVGSNIALQKMVALSGGGPN